MMGRTCCAVLALCAVAICAGAESQARLQSKAKPRPAELPAAQQAEVDDMVHNLLQWIQGIYSQRNRKARQYFGGKPERPRPFEPASYLPPAAGYPAAGARPTPSYDEGPTYQPSSPPSSPTYQPQPPSQPSYSPSQPSYTPSEPTAPTYQPPTYKPNPPNPPTYQPSQPPQPQPTYQPTKPEAPTYQPSQPTPPAYKPSYQPSPQTFQPPSPTYAPPQPTPPAYQPQTNRPEAPTYVPEQPFQPETDGSSKQPTQVPLPLNDEDRHPPHIHALTVECGKDMMTINVEFNKPYNGIIYSQDHYEESECVYVRENTNQIKYSFTVNLNTCGTKFYSDFENEGQAYLENVLIFQNEAGIQEVWDHIRRVRCLWEGNLTKQLVSSLSVGMLNQITSNFSGDTAMARLDIQVGRGPFAPAADGLIKIGETMTLVVSVTGDPGFDILVRECIARDSQMRQIVPLTDGNGCVLKPKLFGAFQKTKETGNTGASVIAFAFFNAFKFPDEMDLIIQCEVELCKTDCEVCPNPGSIEPRRRRRDVIHVGNRTVDPVTTIGKGLRVVLAEDLPVDHLDFCMSSAAALWGAVLVLLASLMSSVAVSVCWQKSRGSAKF